LIVAIRHTLCHISTMAIYRWNAEKNLLLKEARGVSFEQVVMHIERGDLLDVIAHPNSERYPNQKVLILNIGDYIYTVPYVEEGEERFLKTIIPSRKLTRKYLR